MTMKDTAGKQSGAFSPTPYVMMGYATIALAFGVFGTWAATAPLASGVVAHGTVAVMTNRKTIQHLEGGIIQQIAVKEGDIVEAGQVLVKLDPTQASGNVAVLGARLALLRATEARLSAESIDAPDIGFPPEISGAPGAKEPLYLTLQRTLFRDRKATKDGQISILRARIGQLEEEVSGLDAQRQSLASQQGSLDEEIERMKVGEESGYISTNQVAQLMRARMEMEGNLGRIIADAARANQTIAETKLQILQIRQEFVERAGTELRDIRDQVSEVSERLKQAEYVLDRTTITAPVRGKIQSIRYHTTSGVVRPADPIMELIPMDDDLVINARVRPIDVDDVILGGKAEVRFSAFASRQTPVIFGTVQVLSPDIIQSESPQIEPYYDARITVNEKDVPAEMRGRLQPGMPAEVIIASGERTMVDYLIKPLKDSFSKGMLEK
ncbi:MAG: HlyD family type I secretion periplasmic adaptor subunit [Rhizobiaceae bacterium]|nr:HlyD family type I secretion periplasmic adaptor subunit [Rhizobiaceae bacterium]